MKHTILCVDDEKDNLEALQRIFRRKYEVLTATSAQTGLSLLQTHNPVSVILSDQKMPQMTGVEFLEQSIKIQPEAVRMLFTGYTDIESVIAAINSGQIHRYITKPWDPRELEITVDRAVEHFEIGQELKQKNQELQKALKELQSLDEAKSHFMILVNHELKTPLTSLLSYLDLLNESKLNEEQQTFVDRIRSSSARLHEIVRDVLEFVSAETGQTQVVAKASSLSTIVKKVEATLNEALEKKHQTLQVDLSSEKFYFDPKLMESILRRLLHNASRFGDSKTEIHISQENLENKSRITITNKGKPLMPEVIEKILKPFALDEDIMNHSKGIGLGLSICQALLKLQGSQLDISSEGPLVRVAFDLPNASDSSSRNS